jgi:CRISPR-associated protein Cmr3
MTMLAMQPVDAWFFRGSQPYNRGATNQRNASSLFPPHPPTVVGAVRAGLALEQDWDGYTDWNDWRGGELVEVLGDGPDDLGELAVRGPFVLHRCDDDADETWQRLYPAPRHLLGHAVESEDGSSWKPAAMLRPASDETLCDLGGSTDEGESSLGSVRLLETVRASDDSSDKLSEPDDVWLTPAGMADVLGGELPDAEAVYRGDDLWKSESRVGLQLDEETDTAKDGHLYNSSYIRLEESVALGLEVEGVPASWSMPERLALGGESRMANVERLDDVRELDGWIGSGPRIAVTLTTPARFSRETLEHQLEPGELGPTFGPLEGVELVSACIGKATRIGGWDGRERKPLPLKPHLPAGSTLFLEGGDRADAIRRRAEQIRLSEETHRDHGFGEVVVGNWTQRGTP